MNRVSSDGSTSASAPEGEEAPLLESQDESLLPNDECCTNVQYDDHDHEGTSTTALIDDEDEVMAITMADPLVQQESFLQRRQSGKTNHSSDNSEPLALSPQGCALLDQIDKDLLWFVSLTGSFSALGFVLLVVTPIDIYRVNGPMGFLAFFETLLLVLLLMHCAPLLCRLYRECEPLRTCVRQGRSWAWNHNRCRLSSFTCPSVNEWKSLTRDILHDMEQIFRTIWLVFCNPQKSGSNEETENDIVDTDLAIIDPHHDSGDEPPHPIVARV